MESDQPGIFNNLNDETKLQSAEKRNLQIALSFVSKVVERYTENSKVYDEFIRTVFTLRGIATDNKILQGRLRLTELFRGEHDLIQDLQIVLPLATESTAKYNEAVVRPKTNFLR